MYSGLSALKVPLVMSAVCSRMQSYVGRPATLPALRRKPEQYLDFIRFQVVQMKLQTSRAVESISVLRPLNGWATRVWIR